MSEIVHGGSRRPLVAGRTLFDEADELSAMVPASCGRLGRCRECVVEVREGAGRLSARSAPESFLEPGFRLACQARVERVDGDVEFGVLRRRLHILLGREDATTELDPSVRRSDGRLIRDSGHGFEADGAESGEAGPTRGSREDLGPAFGPPLGLAIDVGTTTVVAEVVDLETGETRAVAAFENPQRFGGSDVMSRISYEVSFPGELRRALRRALNRELAGLYRALGVDRRSVVDAVLVGNTTMRDLAFGLDVAPIGHIPYRSVTETRSDASGAGTTAIARPAHELGLLMHPRALVVGPPLVASHVGADAAADLVAIDAAAAREPFLLIDVGTNTEVVAGDGRRLVAASGPAGPAFEGGGVRHGMAGADGAIERARLRDGAFEVETIGGRPPEGMCGSGLVDVLAELRGAARMTGRGGFAGAAREAAVVDDPRIVLTRADVGHLAVAKAATAVGQRVLLRRLGLRPGDLRHVYLAGGFANALDVERAIAIGLVVPVHPSAVVRVGNAAIAGAKRLLLSRTRRRELAALVGRIEHVELEAEDDFLDLFIEGCLFDPIAA